jgi:hypothetical protein
MSSSVTIVVWFGSNCVLSSIFSILSLKIIAPCSEVQGDLCLYVVQVRGPPVFGLDPDSMESLIHNRDPGGQKWPTNIF